MKYKKLLNLLENKCVGFFGCGHLAKCFLKKIINEGFPREKILVSHGGSEETKDFLQKLNIKIVNNQELCKQSKLILYFVRPQEYQAIKGLQVEKGSILLSFLAGVSIKKIKTIFSGEVIRAMPTSPATINLNNSLVAFYPKVRSAIEELFFGFKIYFLTDEEEIDTFSAICTCIPNVEVYLERSIKEEEINDLEKLIPMKIMDLLNWSREVAPKNLNKQEREDYLKKAATKGGINEAILKSLEEGNSVKQALLRGVERNRELNKK